MKYDSRKPMRAEAESLGLLDARTIASMCGITQRNVTAWLSSGTVPSARKIGTRWYASPEDARVLAQERLARAEQHLANVMALSTKRAAYESRDFVSVLTRTVEAVKRGTLSEEKGVAIIVAARPDRAWSRRESIVGTKNPFGLM